MKRFSGPLYAKDVKNDRTGAGINYSRWGGEYMARELRAYLDYEKEFIPKFAGVTYLPASKTMFPVPDERVQVIRSDEKQKTVFSVAGCLEINGGLYIFVM